METRGLAALLHALRATSPVGDLRFVDLEALFIVRRQAGGVTHRAVDVDHASANATDQVMVVVVDAVFVAGGRADRLDSPDQSLLYHHAQGVVYGLARDSADIGLGRIDYLIGTDVWSRPHRVKDRNALRGGLDAVLAK